MTITEQDRVIWRPDLQKTMNVSSETIRRYMRDGKIPTPDVAMSQKKLGWRLSTLRAAGINIAA